MKPPTNELPPWSEKPRRRNFPNAKPKMLWASDPVKKKKPDFPKVLFGLFLGAVALSPVAVIWVSSQGDSQAQAKPRAAKKKKKGSSTPSRFVSADNSGPSHFIMEDVVPEILSDRVKARKEVTTGRFLRDYERNLERLRGIDTSRWRVVRRGRNWVEIEGPWVVDGSSEPRTAVLRFVLSDNKPWRLENIRILREPYHEDEGT